jgi:hypothetical protein
MRRQKNSFSSVSKSDNFIPKRRQQRLALGRFRSAGGRLIVLFDALPWMKIDERGNLAGSRPTPGVRVRGPVVDVVTIGARRRSKFSVRGIGPEILNFAPAARHRPGVRTRVSFTRGWARGNGRIGYKPRADSLGQADRNSAHYDPPPQQQQAAGETANRRRLHGGASRLAYKKECAFLGLQKVGRVHGPVQPLIISPLCSGRQLHFRCSWRGLPGRIPDLARNLADGVSGESVRATAFRSVARIATTRKQN